MKNKIKNLFHYDKATAYVYSAGFLTKENNSLIFDTFSLNNQYPTIMADCIDLKPSTKYICRAIVTEIDKGSINGSNVAGSMRRCLKLQTKAATYDTKVVTILDGYGANYNGPNSEITTKFTTPANLSEYKYIATRMADNMTVIFKDIVIVEDDTIPY